MEKAPLALRATTGPNPSGGKRAAVDVRVTPSDAGHWETSTEPEMVTVPPAGTATGETVTLPAAAAAGARPRATPSNAAAERTRNPQYRLDAPMKPSSETLSSPYPWRHGEAGMLSG